MTEKDGMASPIPRPPKAHATIAVAAGSSGLSDTARAAMLTAATAHPTWTKRARGQGRRACSCDPPAQPSAPTVSASPAWALESPRSLTSISGT